MVNGRVPRLVVACARSREHVTELNCRARAIARARHAFYLHCRVRAIARARHAFYLHCRVRAIARARHAAELSCARDRASATIHVDPN